MDSPTPQGKNQIPVAIRMRLLAKIESDRRAIASPDL